MREDCDSVGEAGSKDPGAARHGNFINYYTFNPPENRLKHIPDTLLANLGVTDSPICILDIGCNAGDLTSALFHSFGTADVRMLGVDLDQQLVDRAVQNFTVEDRLQFQHLDIMSDNFQQEAAKYLSRYNKTKFDLVTVFSVTMWVHLNLGDRGLEELVRRLVAVAACVLVEPQPWKCYQTAARRMRKLGKQEFEELARLEVRGPGVDQQIVEMFLSRGCQLLADFGESKWNRKLVLLKTQ